MDLHLQMWGSVSSRAPSEGLTAMSLRGWGVRVSAGEADPHCGWEPGLSHRTCAFTPLICESQSAGDSQCRGQLQQPSPSLFYARKGRQVRG